MLLDWIKLNQIKSLEKNELKQNTQLATLKHSLNILQNKEKSLNIY